MSSLSVSRPLSLIRSKQQLELLLASVEDQWQAEKKDLLMQALKNFPLEEPVRVTFNWSGAEPKSYPCLAAVFAGWPDGELQPNLGPYGMKAPTQICFVYSDDAERLLAAGSPERPVDSTIEAAPQREDRTEYDRHTKAFLLAMAKELIDIKALDPDRLQKTMACELARIDAEPYQPLKPIDLRNENTHSQPPTKG